MPQAMTSHAPSSQESAQAQVRGAFGDQFGAAGALFSALGLAGVVIALYWQRKEFRAAHELNTLLLTRHTQALRTEIILKLVDEIRSQEWGDAHASLSSWKRVHPNDFIEAFLKARTLAPQASSIDQARRTFLRPVLTLYHLANEDDPKVKPVIDSQLARRLIGRVAAKTLVEVVAPIEEAIAKQIAEDHGTATPSPPDTFFNHVAEWTRLLYTDVVSH